MDPTTMAEHLENACLVLDQAGWTRGTLQDHRGEVCMVGAVAIAVHGSVEEATRAGGISPLINAIRDDLNCEPMQWNDIYAQDVDEVKDALLATAKRLRNLP